MEYAPMAGGAAQDSNMERPLLDASADEVSWSVENGVITSIKKKTR